MRWRVLINRCAEHALAIVTAVACCSACGGTQAPARAASEGDAARVTEEKAWASHPDSSWIVGVACGSTDDEVTRRAFDEVVRQVDAELEVVVHDVIRVVDDAIAREWVRESDISARFDHAELIERNRVDDTYYRGGLCGSAVLGRRQAGEAFRADPQYRVGTTEFNRAVDDAFSATDVWSFALARSAAYDRFEQVVGTASQIRVVAGDVRDLDGAVQRIEALASREGEWRREGRLGVRRTAILSPDDSASASAVEEALDSVVREALRGTVLDVSDEGCPNVQAELVPEIRASCSQTYFGYRCDAVLELRIVGCAGGTESIITAVEVVGAHPDARPAAALHALADSIRDDEIRGEVAGALSPLLRR